MSIILLGEIDINGLGKRIIVELLQMTSKVDLLNNFFLKKNKIFYLFFKNKT